MSERRESVLREMGFSPLWRLRGLDAAEEMLTDPIPPKEVQSAAPLVVPHSPRPSASVMPLTRPSGGSGAVAAAPLPDAGGLGWEALEASVKACTACGLHKRRKQAVFGVGDRQAEWLVVGEGPGAEEDDRGEPFVGEAGKLLDAMLFAIGLKRGENVYIANAVKCRPPGNRTPETEEMDSCFPYLERQIALIRPRLIVAVGRPAAQTLLKREVKISDVRGRVLDYQGIPLVITYHPAYLLRNLHHKAWAWQDLCFIRRTMAGLKQDGEPS